LHQKPYSKKGAPFYIAYCRLIGSKNSAAMRIVTIGVLPTTRQQEFGSNANCYNRRGESNNTDIAQGKRPYRH